MAATLATLQIGDAVLLLARVTAQDPTTGDTLTYYGPAGQPQGTMTISPAGQFTGQLATTPDQIPVQLVPVFAAVTTGDVLQNITSGETYVARQVRIMPDGTYQWAASLTGIVWYTMAAWTVAGHVNL
jgi:hypothetical protein